MMENHRRRPVELLAMMACVALALLAHVAHDANAASAPLRGESRLEMAAAEFALATSYTPDAAARMRVLTSAADQACAAVKADGGPDDGMEAAKSVVNIGLTVASSVPVIGDVVGMLGPIVDLFWPSPEAATPAQIYECMVAYVQEAIYKAVTALDTKLVKQELDKVAIAFKQLADVVRTTGLATAQTRFVGLESTINSAQVSLTGAEDKATVLAALVSFATTQHLPYLRFGYDSYAGLFPNQASSGKDVYRTWAATAVQTYNTSYTAFREAAIQKRVDLIRNLPRNADKDVLTFYDPDGNTDAPSCGTDIGGIWYVSDKSKISSSKSDRYFGWTAAVAATNMMERIARASAEIHTYIGTSSANMWPAMVPASGKVVRFRVKHVQMLPFGAAEFVAAASPALIKCNGCNGKPGSSAAHRWVVKSAPGTGAATQNISKIEIRSGSWIDFIKVIKGDGTSNQIGNPSWGSAATIDLHWDASRPASYRPVTRLDVWVNKDFEGIGQLTGLKFHQHVPGGQPSATKLLGRDHGCGDHGSWGFGGSYHYTFDFSEWKGQVWLCGLDLFSVNKNRVGGVAPTWCYQEAYVA